MTKDSLTGVKLQKHQSVCLQAESHIIDYTQCGGLRFKDPYLSACQLPVYLRRICFRPEVLRMIGDVHGQYALII
jgi:hypothetical protein